MPRPEILLPKRRANAALPPSTLTASIRSHIRLGVLICVGLLMTIGGWASYASIVGAVIASGALSVEGNVKTLQHLYGGVIAEIRVKDGQVVKAGEVMIRLDSTATRASLDAIRTQLIGARARSARFTAERDRAPEIVFPGNLLLLAASDPNAAEVLAGERALFAARRRSLEGQQAQLNERIGQVKKEIEGLEFQRRSAETQLRIGKEELGQVEPLLEKGLITMQRLNSLRRSVAGLEGQVGHATTEIARAETKIGETALQISQTEKNFDSEVLRELRATLDTVGQLEQQRIAAEDKLLRVDITSPIDGVVNGLTVHTIGGVIEAGKPILNVVPQGERLIVAVKVQPNMIDQVRVGQRAVIKLKNFDRRTAPDLYGEVTFVSADREIDPRTQEEFYRATAEIGDDSMRKLEGVRLIAGMPADVFIQTTERTVLQYLVRPLSDQISHTFKER
jgi:HlyD family secretion protein